MEEPFNAISEVREQFGYGKPIIVEEFLTQRDVTMGIIGNPPSESGKDGRIIVRAAVGANSGGRRTALAPLIGVFGSDCAGLDAESAIWLLTKVLHIPLITCRVRGKYVSMSHQVSLLARILRCDTRR